MMKSFPILFNLPNPFKLAEPLIFKVPPTDCKLSSPCKEVPPFDRYISKSPAIVCRFVKPENEAKFGVCPRTIKLFPIYSNFSIPVKEEKLSKLV